MIKQRLWVERRILAYRVWRYNVKHQCCNSCQFELGGECRRRAPVGLFSPDAARWPWVKHGGWCGEWKSKKVITP